MLPNTAATMRQSSAVPTTAGTKTLMMVDVTGTLLEGVACTLVVIETILTVASTLVVIETVLIVEVVKCEWVSKRCVPICGTLLTGGVTADVLVTSVVSLYTSGDDDGVSVEYTVEHFMGVTVSSGSQHILPSSLVQ